MSTATPATPRQPGTRLSPLGWLLGGLVVLAMVGVAVLLYDRQGPGDVGFGVTGFSVVSPTAVRVEWDVNLDPGKAALCLVRARDADGAETGSALVRVGPSTRRSLHASYVLPTAARANTGEVVACDLAAPGQDVGAPVASV